MDDLVTVATFPTVAEAYLAKDFLSRHGIDSMVFDEMIGTLYPSFAVGGIKLKVRVEDAEKAYKIMSEIRE